MGGGTYGVRGLRADAAHDRDEDVLLDRERPGVDLHAEHLDARHDARPHAHERERQQLDHNLASRQYSLGMSKGTPEGGGAHGGDGDRGEAEEEIARRLVEGGTLGSWVIAA